MACLGATVVPTLRKVHRGSQREEGERRAVRACAERRRCERASPVGVLTLTVRKQCHEVAVIARALGISRGTQRPSGLWPLASGLWPLAFRLRPLDPIRELPEMDGVYRYDGQTPCSTP